MSTTPNKYQPSPRLIDDRQRLRELYCVRELTIVEIANTYASVGRTRVHQALQEHGLIDQQSQSQSTSVSSETNGKRFCRTKSRNQFTTQSDKHDRGHSPPSEQIDWSDVQ